MPKGYVIFTVVIDDRALFDKYVQEATATIIKNGGRAIIVDDNPEVIEGQWHGSRTAVLEFDSVEAARNWYRSTEYQAVKERHALMGERNAAILSGFEMPGG